MKQKYSKFLLFAIIKNVSALVLFPSADDRPLLQAVFQQTSSSKSVDQMGLIKTAVISSASANAISTSQECHGRGFCNHLTGNCVCDKEFGSTDFSATFNRKRGCEKLITTTKSVTCPTWQGKTCNGRG